MLESNAGIAVVSLDEVGDSADASAKVNPWLSGKCPGK